MALTRSQTRRFVLLFVGVMLALALFATVAILRGQSDQALQNRVRQQEMERRAQQPRLDDYPGDHQRARADSL